jgi:oligopeptide transport system permease protein
MDLTLEMFEPQPGLGADSEGIRRPAYGFYTDAWMRFRSNRVGVTCLAILCLLLLTGIVGPFFFPKAPQGMQYENIPNASYQNQSPTFGETLLVLEDNCSTPEVRVKEDFERGALPSSAEKIPAPVSLKIDGQAAVEGITLEWEPMQGISGYEIYRTSSGKGDTEIAKLKTAPGSGMLLTRIEDPAQYTYTDSLGLDASEHYVYALVPYIADSETGEAIRGPRAAVVATDLVKTIRLSGAKAIDSRATAGGRIRGRMFLFGTDSLGRDLFARMISGARLNFAIVFLVPSFCLLLGVVYGSLLGLAGGKVDLVFMRALEILDALPSLLLMIILQLVIGKGVLSLIVAMSVFGWTGFARIIRGEALRLRQVEFVQAARLLGAPLPRIIWTHIAPNLAGVILVTWSSRMPGVIIAEAFLSLLGLGLEPPRASWGMILNETARQLQIHPAQFLLPCAVVGGTVLALFLLSDAVSDALNPKLQAQ